MSGQKILDGLRNAVAGNFSRVTMNGQRWVRESPNPEDDLSVKQLDRYFVGKCEYIRASSAVQTVMDLQTEIGRLRALLAEIEPVLTDAQNDWAGDMHHDPSVIAGVELLRRRVRKALRQS